MSWWSTDDPRRLWAVIALLLAAAAIVGLGVGLLLGFAGDGGQTATATSSTPQATTAPSTTPTTPSRSSARPSGRAASEIEEGTSKDIGYLVASRSGDDGVHVTFDRVVFRTGQGAVDYARRYHKDPPGADGVLLVNDNEQKRDLVLSPKVRVMGTRALAGSSTPSEVTVRTLRDAIASQGDGLLLALRYDQLGYVVTITERDRP